MYPTLLTLSPQMCIRDRRWIVPAERVRSAGRGGERGGQKLPAAAALRPFAVVLSRAQSARGDLAVGQGANGGCALCPAL